MAERRQRHEWIDLLRGVAVVGMVWTHSFNTFLAAGLQETSMYREMGFYHGLVAPIFFWVAGLMRGMSAEKPGQPKSAWPTVRRLMMIWLVGCLMHMPWAAVMNVQMDTAAWATLFQCDVLNCLALSCLLLLGIEQLMGANKAKAWLVVAMVGFAFVGLTDQAAGLQTGIIPVDALLSRKTGSLFPMFPWFGFAAAGFAMGHVGVPGWRVALLAAVVAFGVPWIPGETGTVGFFFERLGWVVMIATVAAKLNPHIARKPRWLMLAGRESLWLYVVHLMLIHAVPLWRGQSLEHLVGRTQSAGMVLVIFVLLLSASLAAAWWNERRKQRRANV